MNLPENQNTSTHSESKNSVSVLHSGIPVVNSLSSGWLEKNGWMRKEKFLWLKNGHTVGYDGTSWMLDGKKQIQFIQDLPK